jgi:hypothetical protein
MQSEITLKEREALRRARHSDAAAFEWLYHLYLPQCGDRIGAEAL